MIPSSRRAIGRPTAPARFEGPLLLPRIRRITSDRMNLHDLTAKTIDGRQQSLGDYRGKTLLIVNVASRCGLTPQYTGLQQLYEQYKDRGLEILGFPCNQFGAQEPGTEEEIQTFCSTKYDVTFSLFAKIDVNGSQRSPIYEWLTSRPTEPDGPGDIVWNFAKFVVGPDGDVVARFSPPTAPKDETLVSAIEQSLGRTGHQFE
jgi:glutathione peroxidase